MLGNVFLGRQLLLIRQCSDTTHDLYLIIGNKSDGWLSCNRILLVTTILTLIRNFNWIQPLDRVLDLSRSTLRHQPDNGRANEVISSMD